MQYNDLSDTLLLSFNQTKVAVFEECKPLFSTTPLLNELLKQDAYREAELNEQTSDAFQALYTLIVEELAGFKRMTKRIIRTTVENYADTIVEHMRPFMELLAEQTDFDGPLNERDFIYANSSTTFHLMRDMMTNKKGFSEKETGYYGKELIDNSGQLHGFAELRPTSLMHTEIEPGTGIGLNELENALSSLDELTADIFDLVSYLWMTGTRDREGFIEFHSDDALMLRHYEKGETPEKIKFKERERFNIMRRVAALASVWVALNDGPDRIKIINASELNSKLYNFQDFKKMFDIGAVRMAFDKRTNKPKGIYALQIKPSSLLQPYLDGSKSTLGVLDLKVFKYSYVTQREHKRLTRYLSRQWKIRTINDTLHQPFKVETLLTEMNFPLRLNGIQIRDRFEEVLDDLQKDDVIASWFYHETIDEERIGKKGWIQNYWSHIPVTILPPDAVIIENKKRIALPAKWVVEETANKTEQPTPQKPDRPSKPKPVPKQKSAPVPVPEPEQTELVFEPAEVDVSPELLDQRIKELGYGIRQAAEEIGLSHSALSRYINKKTKKLNKSNGQKIKEWLTSVK